MARDELEARLNQHLGQEEDIEPDPCNKCAGTGYALGLFHEQHKCPECNGTGYLLVTDQQK